MMFQLGAALLDACVLAALNKKDMYGYKLTQEVKSVVNVSESTLYPVLRRLTKDGYLETYDEQYMGRNRRYYRLTDLGKQQYVVYVEEWKQFSLTITTILEGGMRDG